MTVGRRSFLESARKHRTVYILLGLGFSAGMLGGLLGIGGGALVVPGLVFFLSFNQHKAHGTSLAVVLVMSLASVATYARQGHIDWPLAGEMAIGGVVGAWAGARLVSLIHGTLLRRIFCVFLLLVGVRMILNGWLEPDTARHAFFAGNTLTGGLGAVGIGVLTGFLSGLLGIGGGVVMVPAMALLMRVEQHTAQGVSLAAMMPTAFTGMLLHHDMGNVEFRVARWVGVGAVAGGIAGATASGHLGPCVLKLVFGIFICVIAVLMALRKQRPS